MHEIGADVAIITETWLQDRCINDTTVDLAGEHGLDLFTLNRQNIAANGRQYGGVAIASRGASTTMKRLDIRNPDNFEVLCLHGKIKGVSEKIIVIAVYLPPNYPKHKADSCLDYIADVISEAKRQFPSPMIVVGGDWNQWPVAHVCQEHPDLTEVEHGPTRNGRKLDRFLVNFGRAVTESDTLAPLDDGLGRESDHRMAYFRAKVEVRREKKITYSYPHYTDEGAAKFRDWIAGVDFTPMLNTHDVNAQLDFFLDRLTEATDACFDLKTTTRRESDPPRS